MPKVSYYNQIIRIDGKDCFLEVMNNVFHYGKVQFNFIQYDNSPGATAGDKITCKIDVYMDIERAAYLCDEILSGNFAKTVAQAKKEGKFENRPVNDYTSFFVDMGGKPAAKAGREDGKALSRQLKIQAGKKLPWVLRAEVGPGTENETGLIVPEGKPESFINIPLTNEALKELATMLNRHINAYINHVYADNSQRFYPNEKINVFEAKTTTK